MIEIGDEFLTELVEIDEEDYGIAMVVLEKSNETG